MSNQKNQIKAIFDDGVATINGHDYVFTKMTFVERRSVFAYLSKIAKELETGDFSFIDSTEYKKIESTMFRNITYDGMTLTKKNVFEDIDFMEDYLPLVTNALNVISYPFVKGGHGK